MLTTLYVIWAIASLVAFLVGVFKGDNRLTYGAGVAYYGGLLGAALLGIL